MTEPENRVLQLPIAGMTCAACSTRLENNLNRLPGVSARVNLATEQARVDYDPALSTPQQVIDQVARTGFAVPPQSIDLNITGMTCASCSQRLEKALNALPGVEAHVNLATERARVRYQPGLAGIDDLLAAVTRAGYSASPDSEEARASEKARKAEVYRRELRAFAISALLTLPLLAQMVTMFDGHQGGGLPGWVQWLLATPVQFWAGWRFYDGAWKSLKGGGANMDVLVALGTSAAYFFSVAVLLFDPAGHLYFEASAAVVTLVRLGKLLEARAKGRTSTAIEQLVAMQPRTARVERDGAFVEEAIDRIRPGDRVQVRAGERIPVDGMVEEGRSQVDESLLTGESMPVVKMAWERPLWERAPARDMAGIAAGRPLPQSPLPPQGTLPTTARVHTGTQNLDGMLVIRAEGVGAHTQLMEIVRLTEAAQGSKAPIQKLADRISGIFVPAVIILAVLTFVGWWLASGDFTTSLIPAVAVLVIACPCALGLATPTAVMVGLGRGAQLGILVRSAEAMERAERLDTLAVDKTGTLTLGQPALLAIEPEAGLSDQELLRLAAGLEQGSSHPLAAAVLTAARERGIAIPTVEGFENIPGEGVVGTVDGRRLRLARVDQVDGEAMPTATWVALTEGGTRLGRLAFADRLRPTSVAAVARLKRAGVRVIMLTGDNPATAAAIAREAGIDEVRAEVRPGDKAAAVDALKAAGRVVGMAGDGINDAPALAGADIGFAMSSGADIALEAADITLMRADLNAVADAVGLSRAVMGKIRQNLFLAFVYNVLALPLAALGYLNPVIAGAAMALSSVSVVSNSLLLKRWRPDRAE